MQIVPYQKLKLSSKFWIASVSPEALAELRKDRKAGVIDGKKIEVGLMGKYTDINKVEDDHFDKMVEPQEIKVRTKKGMKFEHIPSERMMYPEYLPTDQGIIVKRFAPTKYYRPEWTSKKSLMSAVFAMDASRPDLPNVSYILIYVESGDAPVPKED